MSLESTVEIEEEPVVCFISTNSGSSCQEIFEQSLKVHEITVIIFKNLSLSP